MKTQKSILAGLLSLGAGVVMAANPIFTDTFTADPAALVVKDTVYVYAGHDAAKDGEMFNMPAWRCYSSKDLVTWKCHGDILKPDDFKFGEPKSAWAAQVIENGGKYYWYVTVKHLPPGGGNAIAVAVADSPTGPFKPASDKALITDDMTKGRAGWNDIDPTIFLEKDGTPWLCWGNGNCYMVKLKKNMIELDGKIQEIPLPHYVEGPWLYKRGSLYYLIYAAMDRSQGGAEVIAYATASAVDGPWTFRGFVTGSAQFSFTIHPAVIDFKGRTFFFYHNAALVLNGQKGATGRRAVCLDELFFNEDGTIKPLKQTKEGITKPVVEVKAPAAPANKKPQEKKAEK